jgi:hypothetical protein
MENQSYEDRLIVLRTISLSSLVYPSKTLELKRPAGAMGVNRRTLASIGEPDILNVLRTFSISGCLSIFRTLSSSAAGHITDSAILKIDETIRRNHPSASNGYHALIPGPSQLEIGLHGRDRLQPNLLRRGCIRCALGRTIGPLPRRQRWQR